MVFRFISFESRSYYFSFSNLLHLSANAGNRCQLIFLDGTITMQKFHSELDFHNNAIKIRHFQQKFKKMFLFSSMFSKLLIVLFSFLCYNDISLLHKPSPPWEISAASHKHPPRQFCRGGCFSTAYRCSLRNSLGVICSCLRNMLRKNFTSLYPTSSAISSTLFSVLASRWQLF